MNRTPLIAGNWKMYKTGPEAVAEARKLAELCRDTSGVDIMIAPTSLSLPLVSQALDGSRVKTGAQNIHFESQGAFTGEISADMVKAAGAEYVILGHSERRQFFGETDESVNLKIRAAVKAGLAPVLCIGETEAEREAEKTVLVLDKQVSDGLKSFVLDELKHLVLAYEPVWAIGTGKTAGPEQVDEVHRALRARLESLFTKEFAQQTRILYGGSVKPANAKELMGIEDVDGALVGGASLDAQTFINIVTYNK